MSSGLLIRKKKNQNLLLSASDLELGIVLLQGSLGIDEKKTLGGCFY